MKKKMKKSTIFFFFFPCDFYGVFELKKRRKNGGNFASCLVLPCFFLVH